MAKLTDIVPVANLEIIKSSGVNSLLAKVRPHWKAKNLIQRVKRILPIDPSSACQRIFNAAIHDLKEKIVIAGIDIAGEAARQNKLPKIGSQEDVEKLSVSRTIALAYRMGLLRRPEWRRLLRVYDIRRDLEHEDDEYEAGVEDCVYIFKTCIEVVLANDPIQVIKLTDVKYLVEQPVPSTIGQVVLDDYNSAPEARKLDIYKFLISGTLNPEHPDIVRQNCYSALVTLREFTDNRVIIDASSHFQERLGRRCPTITEARVAASAGILPYLKKAHLKDFFKDFHAKMERTGYGFKNHQKHGVLLRNLIEIGGLDYCPDEFSLKIIKWLILCYVGEPSFGQYEHSRRVFYSNVGAPLALEILKETQKDIYDNVMRLRKKSKRVKAACSMSEHVERRFQELLDNIEM